MNDKQLLREYIELLLLEMPVPLRKPKTPEQRSAFMKLLQWAVERMKAPKQVFDKAVEKATKQDNWDEAIELLRDFYILKGIEFKQPAL